MLLIWISRIKTENFAESNIITHYKTLRISIGLVKTYGQRFFSKNDGALL